MKQASHPTEFERQKQMQQINGWKHSIQYGCQHIDKVKETYKWLR